MSVVAAFADGCRRVLRAPALLVGLWLAYVLVPAGVGVSFDDFHVALIEASAMDPTLALVSIVRSPAMVAHATLVTFLLGGMMDRLARDRATASYGFFGACGMFFFRFVRLAVIAAPIYIVVLFWLYPMLPTAQPTSTAILLVLLLAVHVIVDYAKVRMVVEDRRSAFGALVASLRYVRRHSLAVLGLAVLNGLVAVAVWWLGATFEIGITMAVYAYLLARVLLRLIFVASQIALFQSRLAHAGYTARPIARWPDSPAADAVLPQ